MMNIRDTHATTKINNYNYAENSANAAAAATAASASP